MCSFIEIDICILFFRHLISVNINVLDPMLFKVGNTFYVTLRSAVTVTMTVVDAATLNFY
jgi:hypothetical protein